MRVMRRTVKDGWPPITFKPLELLELEKGEKKTKYDEKEACAVTRCRHHLRPDAHAHDVEEIEGWTGMDRGVQDGGGTRPTGLFPATSFPFVLYMACVWALRCTTFDVMSIVDWFCRRHARGACGH